MPRQSAIVTDAELSVLEYLWEQGPAAVRDISKAVYQNNTAAFHATVNSLLDQLERKGYVKRDRTSFAHIFAAKTERSVLVGQQLQQVADSHFGGALSPMLLALIDNLKLKPRDRNAIRKIIQGID
jgi:BlaI family transcriptional regulator, penicillinase repressor